MGIKKLEMFNRALSGKWVWLFSMGKECLWMKVVEKYGPLVLEGSFRERMGKERSHW